jgi:hypothetical protein
MNVAELLSQRRRWRRRAAVSLAFVALVTAGLVPVRPPSADGYALLFTELAREHHEATGTATVVREVESAVRIFNYWYGASIRRAFVPLKPPEDGFLQFSMLPGLLPLQDVPFADYLADDPPKPDTRIHRRLERDGLVTVHGEMTVDDLVPHHLYLIPLEPLDVRPFDPAAEPIPDARRVAAIIPVVAHTAVKRHPALFEAEPALLAERVREAAIGPLGRARERILPWVAGVGVIALGWSLRRLVRARRELVIALAREGIDAEAAGVASVRALLFAPVERRLAEMAARRREEYAATQERMRIEHERAALLARFEDAEASLGLTPDERSRAIATIGKGDLDEGRELVSRFEGEAARRREEHERVDRDARDREREIARLEAEFEAIPDDGREGAARAAWAAYDAARGVNDPKWRLAALKAARKLIPKSAKPDRF